MSKLAYIQSLLGKCPAGYEIEKYMAGGCVKCRKQEAKLLSCGGKPKKRIKK